SSRRREDRADFNPDFVFQSRGRLTPDGYTVEVRIPLKSLKFAAGPTQRWGINVIRSIAATGAEEAWAPLSRGNPSRLAQSGTLEGIQGLRPGRLLEANPTATARRLGARGEDGFARGAPEPDFGVNLKYGLTSNLTLDATVNPDFSQIEADAGQITVNERFAVSVPEKRPFFLEGVDVFATPEPLVHTRTIVDPSAGAKLTGKVGAFGVGYLGAVDESPLAAPGAYVPRGARALFNVARVQRDVGSGSSVGALLTSRETGETFNRVAGLDARVRFGGIYTWQLQGAGSWTRAWRPDPAGHDSVGAEGSRIAVGTQDQVGHLLATSVDRTGRRWGFRLQARDLPEEFRSGAGFIRRTGLTDLSAVTRLSSFGGAGALLENRTVWISGNRIYRGRSFWGGDAAEEGSGSVRTSLSLRGNHRIDASYSNRFFVLDPAPYAVYSLPGADGATVRGDALVGPVRELDGMHGASLGASSSYFRRVSAGASVEWQQTPIFAEGTPGRQWSMTGEVALRPTDALRVDASLRRTRITRERDGSLYSVAMLPRIKAEYQLSRAVSFRAVGQYAVEEVDVLRSPGGSPYLRGGAPFRVRRGRRVAEDEAQLNPLQLNLLFSYQPSPGTVVFLGYGREMDDREAFRFGGMEPRTDGLFLKVSYLFRR
ncbi:MAG TPA: DUF5916 domain-containing protein, partial [Longimicrobiaceae bacterium]|nr:DUF5916 domain-containing protein [Longimicrobiaceae bacterium]